MAIKLKKFINDKNRGKLLLAAWMFLPIILVVSLFFRSYSSVEYYGVLTFDLLRIYESISLVLFWVSVFFGIILLFVTNVYRKKYLNPEQFELSKLDKIPSEIFLLLFLGSGASVFSTVADCAGRDIYVLGHVLEDGGDIFRFAVIFEAQLLVLYGSVFVLYLRYVQKTFLKTCWCVQAVESYKNRTALEKQIQDKQKVVFTRILLLFLILDGAFLFEAFYEEKVWLLIAFAVALCLEVLILKNLLLNKTYQETGKLVCHIEALAKGEEVPKECRLSSEDLLYEADCNLANIETAMEKSIQEQLKAERLKVDLITNMSHDLKTPLTSMIGYIDLLKKEELTPTAQDYIEVLGMKQEQLKDMIQDLFELSKATSNVEQLQMERLDMSKLLVQVLGDLEENPDEGDSMVRLKLPEEPLYFTADSRKMYRVVQNLLENAKKYALAGTRIYVTAQKSGNKVLAEIKNTASYEMDFSPDEITERFVRGDKARTTKGHGLGLAIVSSFVKNMAGNMKIEIDGDLFKVRIEFPYTEENEVQEWTKYQS